jgi:mycoredoxin
VAKAKWLVVKWLVVVVALVLAYPLALSGYHRFRAATAPTKASLAPAGKTALSSLSSSKVVMFGTDWCPYCAQVRTLFKRLGVDYVELDLDRDQRAKEFARQYLKPVVTPIVVIGNRVLKGYNEAEITSALHEL